MFSAAARKVSSDIEGLTVLEAFSVTRSSDLWMTLQRIRDLVLGKLESIVLYSVEDGRLSAVVKENISLSDILRFNLSNLSSFALVRDSGLRRKIEDLGSVVLNGMMPRNAQAQASLTARVFTADRIKTDSPEVFSAIDCIGKAIDAGKQICFQYINYLPDKRMVLRNNEHVYKVSPLAMLWNDGRYYARSIDPEKPNRVNYRIDRMRNVTIADEAAEKDPDYNPSEYAKVAHLMFDGGKKAEEITLLADNGRMINIIDKFGDKIEPASRTTIISAPWSMSFRAIPFSPGFSSSVTALPLRARRK